MWIALDCGIVEHRKMALLSGHEARWGWIVTLVAAKRQPRPGLFASPDHLRYLLGDGLGDYVDEYLQLKLLERRKDGSVLVHDWRRYQRDPTAAERQRRFRWRHRDATVTGNVTRNGRTRDGVTDTRARPRVVSVPVVDLSTPNDQLEVSAAEGGVGETIGLSAAEVEVFTSLARQGAFIREDSGYGRRLLGLIERRTAERVLETVHEMARSGPRSDRQWVFDLETHLEPPERPQRSVARDREAEAEQQRERRSERVMEQMMARRMEWYRQTGTWPAEWGAPPEELDDLGQPVAHD